MPVLEIPEPTANLKALAKRYPVDYQRIYQFFWEALDDFEEPQVKDPSFSKAGGQAQDAIDGIIAEEEERMYLTFPSLHYYSQGTVAIRDMVCMVAYHRRTGTALAADPATLALANESPEVLSALRKFFVERIGDDYLWEDFTAPDYMSLSVGDRADIDEFVREVQTTRQVEKQQGEPLREHELQFVVAQAREKQTLRCILSKLAAPEPQWEGIMQHIAVDAARVVSAQRQGTTDAPKRKSGPTRFERLVEVLFDEEEWVSSDVHIDGQASYAVPGLHDAVVSPLESDDSQLDLRERLFYRTLHIADNMTGARYREFIERYGRRELFDLLKRSVDAEVWENILGGKRMADKQYLQSLHEDEDSLRCPGGWYLAVGADTADIQFFKKYVGQTIREIRKRVLEHQLTAAKLQRYLIDGDTVDDIQRRNGIHLLSFVWASKATRTFKFIRLGSLQGNLSETERPLWLNIVEMYFCLIFKTLQPGTLRKYLGVDEVDDSHAGLNIALPLHQSYRNESIGSTIACLQSNDPEITRYARARLRYSAKKGQERLKCLKWVSPGRASFLRRMEGLNWKPVATGGRRASPSWKFKFRDPKPEWGEPSEVKVYCKQCGFTKYDTAPVIHIHTGAYVIREHPCLWCKRKPSDIVEKRVHAGKYFYPVEPIHYIRA